MRGELLIARQAAVSKRTDTRKTDSIIGLFREIKEDSGTRKSFQQQRSSNNYFQEGVERKDTTAVRFS